MNDEEVRIKSEKDRKWQGLTDGEIYDCFQQKSLDKAKQRRAIFNAIEAKLKDKNRGNK